ncbi:MAG: mobile mystery protein B [Mucilaginibacter sp.]
MGIDFNYTEGQTPLDEDEKEGLLISTITTHGELDEFEQLNIQKVMEWTIARRFKAERILTEAFIKELHKKMFGDTWAWAGKFRNTNKNIGVNHFQVSIGLRNLLDEVKFWIDRSTYSPNEIAIRFKHRIVSIHCFPNGNGRHSRLLADVVIEHIFKEPVYSWGSANLVAAGDARKIYLTSLRDADKGDFSPLIEFARS